MMKTRSVLVLVAAMIGSLAFGAGLSGAAAAPDYSDSIAMSWDGTNYNSTTLESFVGTPVVVPGDSVFRTLKVRNDGPTPGVLRATIINVRTVDPDAPDVHHNPNHVDPDAGGAMYGGPGLQGKFYEDLKLSYKGGANAATVRSFADLSTSATTMIGEYPLAKGATTDITIGYGLPIEATSGNKANVAPRLATFDVLLEIQGEFPRYSLALDMSVKLDKDKGQKGKADAGDTAIYTYKVTNTGEETVTDIRVVDPRLANAGVGVTCALTTLHVGQSTICTSTPYTITKKDAASKKIVSTAVAFGKPGGDLELGTGGVVSSNDPILPGITGNTDMGTSPGGHNPGGTIAGDGDPRVVSNQATAELPTGTPGGLSSTGGAALGVLGVGLLSFLIAFAIRRRRPE